jgi:hypothetical protein
LFGADFRSDDVDLLPWGTARVSFHGCDSLSLTYGNNSFTQDPGGIAVTRLLSRAPDANCPLAPTGTAGTQLGGQHSGVFFNESRSGEGIQLATGGSDGERKLVMVFYTYDLQRRPLYLIGDATQNASAESAVTIPVVSTSGSLFGAAFNRNDVGRTAWGTVTLRFEGCDVLDVSWTSSVAGFGSGQSRMRRIGTRLGGLPCGANRGVSSESRTPMKVESADRRSQRRLTPSTDGVD